MKKLVSLFFVFCIFPFVAFAQWSNNPDTNTMINDTIGSQNIPMVVKNSVGETYISWFSEFNNLNYDVYLQKLDSHGVKMWEKSGLLISDHPTNTWVTTYDMKLDKEDNVILVTQDQRTGTSNVFAYKISPQGDFLWGNDGLQLSNTTGFDPSPKIEIADNGDVVFMWVDIPQDTTVSSSVILKRVSSDGTILWNAKLADSLNDFTLPQILHTENDDFIVSWMTKSMLPDTTLGQIYWMHVFAQKIDNQGNSIWVNNVQIDSGKMMPYTHLFSIPYLQNDGSGGAYIMWQSFSYQTDDHLPTTYVNRIFNDGSIWKPNGVLVSLLADDNHTGAAMVYLDGADKLMVCWNEYHYDAQDMTDCWGIYGQLFNPDGQYVWDENGKKIIDLVCTEDTTYKNILLSKSIDSSAALVYGKEFLNIISGDTSVITNIYSLSLNTEGEFVWNPQIIPLSTSQSLKGHLYMSNLSNEQWVVAWEDDISNPDDEFNTGIYAQNLHVDGMIGPSAINMNPENGRALTVFPNPANDKIMINNIDGITVLKVIIYNSTGQKVFVGQPENSGIDVSGFHPGVYVVEIITREARFRDKLIIR